MHATVKHYVSIVGIIALVAFGVAYLYSTPDPNPSVVGSIVLGIAGLGGYNLAQRRDTSTDSS